MNEKNVLMNSVFWEVTQYNNIPNQEKLNIDQRRAAPTLSELSEIVNFYVNVKKFFKHDVIVSDDYSTDEITNWCNEKCKGPWIFGNRDVVTFTVSDDAVLFKLTFSGRD